MLVLPVLLSLIPGCYPDDWDGRPYTGWHGSAASTGDTGAARSALIGEWISEGEDLAPLLAGPPFSYLRVDARFGADGAYAVTSVTVDLEVTLSGVWSTDESTDPATVVLSQVEPYEAEATGIWAVDGDVLTYEVVQTTPDYGFSAPTPASGFGSTAGPGLEPGVNVQIYRRSP